MQLIQKMLRLSKHDYYETHLSLINCLLPTKLTPMEIKVLSRFMALEGDITNYRFGKSARKMVREKLGLSFAGLSNYMGSLTKKKFLIDKGDDLFEIWPLLLPDKIEQSYAFKLINNGQETIENP